MNEGIRWCPHCREPHSLASRFCPATGQPIETQLHASAPAAGLQHPLAGTLFDESFEIVRRIGKGGMNEVFEARQRATGLLVALKVVRDASRDGASRLKREAEIIGALAHRNICAPLGAGATPDGRPYLVLERLEGETLETKLHGGRRLSVQSALAIFMQILAALAHAHERGIVHRDIKPSNIFLVDRGEAGPLVKVLDFGLAFDTIRRGARMTRPGRSLGTPRYMAPEQLIGSPVTPAADLFAVALMLYEALAGEHPFAALTIKETARRILYDIEVDLAKRRPSLPFGIVAVVHAGLAKRAKERPESASHMLAALNRVEGHVEEPESTDSVDSQRSFVRS